MTNAELMTKSEWVAHACSMPRSASLLDLFNANGAYQPSLGQRPREVEPFQIEALKARFIQPWCLGQADIALSALGCRCNSNSWALPQAYVRKRRWR